jgi:hypothetical protein
MPDSPIVVIDMPYARKAGPGTDYGDSEKPFRINRSEAQVSLAVLRSLRPAADLAKKPTLAILSPYAEQVKLLRSTLGASNIGHLEKYFRPERGGDFFGTVDSFQGREADCVVVSLVRNNEHTNPVKALGFLAQSNRMNVLMSRAKHKLIIIGSFEFIDHVLNAAGNKSDVSLDFFRRLRTAIYEGTNRQVSSAEKTPEISIVDFGKI